jgi:rhodanese-related sulfurtransferase
MSKPDFIREVTEGLLAPPKYFPQNVKMNKEGYSSFDDVMKRSAQALSPDAFELAVNETHAVMIDVRDMQDFASGFIPNSIYIGLEGSFAPWVGALVADVEHPIALIVQEGKEEEAITRMARVGFDNVIGYLKGGIEAWKKAGKDVDRVDSINSSELRRRMKQYGEESIVDVRRPGEFAAEHVKDANNFPLDFFNDFMHEFDREKQYFLHCAGGYRSLIAASILKSRGFEKITDISGGFVEIKESELFDITDYVCPNNLKRHKAKEVVAQEGELY